MGFLSDLLDSSPEFGCAKAIVHFAFGNQEAGYKALVFATRSYVILRAGIEAGKAAGPGGGMLAAVGTGACYDLMAANLSGGKYVSGLARIRADNSWGSGGIEILGDVICGMSIIVDDNKEPWESIMKRREGNVYNIHVKNDIFMWGLTIRAAGSVNQGLGHLLQHVADKLGDQH